MNTGKADWSLRLVRPIKSSCGVSATLKASKLDCLQPALREPSRIRTLETTPLLRREKREAQPMPTMGTKTKGSTDLLRVQCVV